MSARPVSLRIPEEIRASIEETAVRSGRGFSSVANEMLTEAVKMRHIPGIVFADGPAGRRARIAGTGIDVFEIVRDYRAMGADWAQLRQAYGLDLEFLKDTDGDGFPDVIDPDPLKPGFKNGVR